MKSFITFTCLILFSSCNFGNSYYSNSESPDIIGARRVQSGENIEVSWGGTGGYVGRNDF